MKNPRIVSRTLAGLLTEEYCLSSPVQQRRNSMAYRNTILKEAKRLQEKQRLEIALLLKKVNTKS